VDQTALLQQAAPGIDSQQFLDLLSSQLGLEGDLEAEGTQEAGGRTWTLYASETQGALVDIALAEDEGITFVVLLFSHSDERDALVTTVLLPALEAIAIDA
jgi:hypothetical protein